MRIVVTQRPDTCEEYGHEIITMCSRCGIEAHEL